MIACDVLVVGAGIIGAACAYRLAQRGLKTVVIDSATAPASGSTGRSVAGVRVQFTSEVNIRLSWESIQEYRAFTQLYGEDSEYRAVGYLFLVPDAAWPDHRDGVNLQQRLGVPVKILGTDEAQRIVPFEPRGIAAATFGAADGVIDPHRVTLTYLRLARALGAKIVLDSPLQSAHRRRDQWVVTTSSDTIRAPFIVNAAGAWSGEVARRAGLDVPVVPMRRMVFSTVPTDFDHHYPLTVDVETGFYMRSEGQRILFGRSNPDEAPGFRTGMDWNWLGATIDAGLARFAWLESTALDRRASWWGYYEVTPDHNPIIGEMPEAKGWVNACGFSGHGVQQAAATGRVVADEIVDGKTDLLDITPLRYERFTSAEYGHERHIV